MTMRIAVVLSHPIQHFAPQFRSWSRQVDVQVKVFYGSSLGSVAYLDRDFGIRVGWGESVLDGYDSIILNPNQQHPKPVNFRLDSRSLDKHLDDFDPTAVISYGYAQLLQWRGRRWAINNKRHLAYISDGENRHLARGKPSRSKRTAVAHFLRSYGTILTVGDANEDYYRTIGVSKSKFIRMGFPIDVDAYDQAWRAREALRVETRARLGIKDEEIAVLIVGKLIERKRQIDALHACERARASANIRLMLAGSGPDEPLLRQWASENNAQSPIFVGFTPPEELPAIYAAADIYLHPSSFDPHPLAISEAIYMGLPVLVSDKVGSWGTTDDVIPHVNGLVFESGNVPQLEHLLSELAADASLRETFSQKSRSLALLHQSRSHGRFLSDFVAFINGLRRESEE